MRKSKQDWLDVGLKTLAHEGKVGLTIDALAKEMSLTKGSFYHHFENMGDYEEQLVGYWANQFLSTAGNVPETRDECLALLDWIVAQGYAPSTEAEVAMRTWAQADGMVRGWVEQVDKVREEFLRGVFWRVEGEARAEVMAQMLFTILIGCLATFPRRPIEEVEVLYREFKRVYGLG
jgi:AcrR family transcriptional regulator